MDIDPARLEGLINDSADVRSIRQHIADTESELAQAHQALSALLARTTGDAGQA